MSRRPVACVPEAIPAGERERHRALARRLFADGALETVIGPTGMEARFEVGALLDLARFVANERRCCPFLGFTIRVEAGATSVWLTMTGPPGTGEMLRTELPEPRRGDVEA